MNPKVTLKFSNADYSHRLINSVKKQVNDKSIEKSNKEDDFILPPESRLF